MTNQSKTAAKSWARANRLATLANIPPKAARNYIKNHPNPTIINLLDNGSDSRNQTLKAYINDATLWSPQTTIRKSKGDPKKPPRAGAPATYTTLPGTTPPGTTCPEWIQTPNNQETELWNDIIPTNETPIELLQTLKKLATQNGGLQGLRTAIQNLENLQL